MIHLYTEIKTVQGSGDWHYNRNKLWLTGSNVGTAVGHCPFKNSTRAKLLEELVNIRRGGKKTAPNAYMVHGTRTEPTARKWYETKTGKVVRETGILIPSWDPEIGGSLDGLVDDDGIIEIKCPKKMYDVMIDPGFGNDLERIVGVPLYHYDQIQFYLAVTQRKWCDYIVYTTEQVGCKRILRNEGYFTSFLYPEIRRFIKDLKEELNKPIPVTSPVTSPDPVPIEQDTPVVECIDYPVISDDTITLPL